MVWSVAAIIGGLALLAWSADRFVDGAAHVAARLGVSSLLIGMVVVGFGTSAPEMLVSALAAWAGQAELAVGNAYGSNIANVGLILGLAAVIAPMSVRPGILRWELPLLTVITLLAVAQLPDGMLSRWDAWWLLLVFAAAMALSIRRELRLRADEGVSVPPVGAALVTPDTVSAPPPPTTAGVEAGTVAPAAALAREGERVAAPMTTRGAVFCLVAGLACMAAASRALVWGAVNVATALGVDELVIGLTIVSVGTSLPELASSVAAARKGESDLALGNVLGSNLFNTLAVVGISGLIKPFAVPEGLLSRDVPVMLGMTLALSALGYGGRNRDGVIGRGKGVFLLATYAGYLVWLILTPKG